MRKKLETSTGGRSFPPSFFSSLLPSYEEKN